MSSGVISVYFRRAFSVLFPVPAASSVAGGAICLELTRTKRGGGGGGNCGSSVCVRPSGRLMMRRPATRGYSAVSAGADLSGINRRPSERRPAPRPRSTVRPPGGRPGRRSQNAPAAGCLHMSNQCMTSRREICIHKWSAVIRAGPGDDLSYQLRRRPAVVPASWGRRFHLPRRPPSASPASQVPLGCSRKSVGVCWSRRRQEKASRGDTTRPMRQATPAVRRNAAQRLTHTRNLIASLSNPVHRTMSYVIYR